MQDSNQPKERRCGNCKNQQICHVHYQMRQITAIDNTHLNVRGDKAPGTIGDIMAAVAAACIRYDEVAPVDDDELPFS